MPTLDDLRAHADHQPDNPEAWFALGSAQHAASQPEAALVSFERALALAPGHPLITSACASVLLELQRASAAWTLMAGIEDTLLGTADGAANLGLVAEVCGRTDDARRAYLRALELAPEHGRALNNLALLEAGRRDTSAALGRFELLLHHHPEWKPGWINAIDIAIGAHAYPQALAWCEQARRHHGADAELQLREVLTLVASGQLQRAQRALADLGPQGPQLLQAFVAHIGSGDPRRAALVPPSLLELFCGFGLRQLQDAHWGLRDAITDAMRALLAEGEGPGPKPLRDWRDLQFLAMLLPLDEDEVRRLRRHAAGSLQHLFGQRDFDAPARPRRDPRVRLGLSTRDLADARHSAMVLDLVRRIDRSRFIVHIYSATPIPRAEVTQQLRPHVDSVVELHHLKDHEARQRIWLDELDVWFDFTGYSPACRVPISFAPLAPVQMFSQMYKRHHPDVQRVAHTHALGDAHTHPGDALDARFGQIVRLPQTCWLDFCDDAPPVEPAHEAQRAARAPLGLPAQAFVIVCWAPAALIDPDSFHAWMGVLRVLDTAVLWLGDLPPLVRERLRDEARVRGVDPARLHFAPTLPREQALQSLSAADVHADPMHFNAVPALCDALHVGVPAVSRSGASQASRLGGSVLRAAGLGELVTDRAEAYALLLADLGRERGRLAALRLQLQQARAQRSAPLFDRDRLLADWQRAWELLALRARQGQPPAPLDLAGPATQADAQPASAGVMPQPITGG